MSEKPGRVSGKTLPKSDNSGRTGKVSLRKHQFCLLSRSDLVTRKSSLELGYGIKPDYHRLKRK